MNTGALFAIIGLAFGTPYANTVLNNVLWYKTSVAKRLARSIFGVGVSYGI
jgi:hypothetical protein